MNAKKMSVCRKCAGGKAGTVKAPGAAPHAPDANVAIGGQCMLPADPESSRPDTGEPCDDGRADGRR